MDSNMMMMVFIIIIIGGMMWFQSRSNKKKQSQQQDWRANLKAGERVATYSGLIGTVEWVSPDRDEIVLNSAGSLSRWRIQAITEAPVVPEYVTDEEYEEQQAAQSESEVNESEEQLQQSENVEIVKESTSEEPETADADQDADKKVASEKQ